MGHLGGAALRKLDGPINLGRGGCFVAGTKVKVDSLPVSADVETTVAEIAKTFGNAPVANVAKTFGSHVAATLGTSLASSSLPTPTSQLVPIESVPLGSRIGTVNPQSWDYDDSLPDPERSSWSKIELTIVREDGVVVDVELLRPDQWILDNNVFVGSALPIHIEELDVNGTATVNALSACPDLAIGAGECVTGRFVTRQVAETIKLTMIDGTELEGTPVHPVWSVDREDFVELSELQPGERLQTTEGPLAIGNVETLNVVVPVYNIEVRGQHVYEVTDLCILVHNAGDCVVALQGDAYNSNWDRIFGGKDTFDYGKYLRRAIGPPPAGMVRPHSHHILFKEGLGPIQQKMVAEGQVILRKHGIHPKNGLPNLVWAPNIEGQHTTAALKNVLDTLKMVDQAGGSRDDIIEALIDLGQLAAART